MLKLYFSHAEKVTLHDSKEIEIVLDAIKNGCKDILIIERKEDNVTFILNLSNLAYVTLNEATPYVHRS